MDINSKLYVVFLGQLGLINSGGSDKEHKLSRGGCRVLICLVLEAPAESYVSIILVLPRLYVGCAMDFGTSWQDHLTLLHAGYNRVRNSLMNYELMDEHLHPFGPSFLRIHQASTMSSPWFRRPWCDVAEGPRLQPGFQVFSRVLLREQQMLRQVR